MRALVVLLTLVAIARPLHADCRCRAKEVVNAAHRGTGENKPGNPFAENTLPAFAQGVVEGATMIELDVQHTSDGVLVVMHDDTVDRTTTGSGCVTALTLAQVRALDAAKGTPMAGTGVTVPTFEELLAATSVDVNVEIKINGGACPPSDKPRLAADVVRLLQADGKPRKFHVSSFDVDALDEVRKLSPTLELGYLTFDPNDADVAVAHGFDAINVSFFTVSPDAIAAIRAKGLKANLWTVNQPGDMRGLVDDGADMIITDEPDVFAGVQRDACAAPCKDGGCGIAPSDRPRRAPLALLLALPLVALVVRRARAR